MEEIWNIRHFVYDNLFLELFDEYTKRSSHEDMDIIIYGGTNYYPNLLEYHKYHKIAKINRKIWDAFQTKFDINYEQFQNIMTKLLEKHLDIEAYVYIDK